MPSEDILLTMRPVYALRDAKALDSFLISKYSLSSSRLIDKAGALSAAIVEKENENASILVLLGPPHFRS